MLRIIDPESYSLKSMRYAYFLTHHRLIRQRVPSLDDFGRSRRQRSRVSFSFKDTFFFPRVESSHLFCRYRRAWTLKDTERKYFVGRQSTRDFGQGRCTISSLTVSLVVFWIWCVTDLISAIRFEDRPIVRGNTDNCLGHDRIKKHTSTSSCSCSRWRKTKLDEYSELLNIKTLKIAFHLKSSYSFSVAFRCVSSASVLHVMKLSF